MNEFQHKGEPKKRFVQTMFDDISHKYDFLNHLLSFGIDLYWRKVLVDSLQIKESMTILDVATGTGDVGFKILKNNNVKIIGIDYSFNMVKVAKQKAKAKGFNNKFKLIQGDAENLPIANDSIDVLTISFGFRNIGHYEKAMKEFYRVIKPGGSCFILEFQEPVSPIIGKLYSFYFKNILPVIGAIFSRSDAYRYLPESVQNFLNRVEMESLMKASGFSFKRCKNLTFGISSLFEGKKDYK